MLGGKLLNNCPTNKYYSKTNIYVEIIQIYVSRNCFGNLISLL